MEHGGDVQLAGRRPRLPDVHRHRVRGRRALGLPDRLRHPGEHRPVALPRRACRTRTAPTASRAGPSCSRVHFVPEEAGGAGRAVRRRDRRRGRQVRALRLARRARAARRCSTRCPNRFVGRVLERMDAGDHDAILLEPVLAERGTDADEFTLPPREADRAGARGVRTGMEPEELADALQAAHGMGREERAEARAGGAAAAARAPRPGSGRAADRLPRPRGLGPAELPGGGRRVVCRAARSRWSACRSSRATGRGWRSWCAERSGASSSSSAPSST